MTTPPLDLPAERLTALRDIANAATPGPWESRGYEVETVPEFDLHRFDVMSETVASCDLLKSDAAHIAAFDPPTVLALLDLVEAAERDLAAVREVHAPVPVIEAWGTQGRYPREVMACIHCTSPDDSSPTPYPCPTIKRLGRE